MFAVDSILREKPGVGKRWLKVIYAVAALVCCYLTLEPLAGHISRSIRMVCGLLCVISVLRSGAGADRIKKVFDRPWKKILQALLEMYGTFAMVGMYVLPSGIEPDVKYPAWFFFILAFFWMHPVMKCFIAFLIKTGDTVSVERHETGLKARFLLMGIVLLPCMVFLAAFNPAITTSDSVYCFEAAHQLWQPDFSMQDWQPPFYVFVLNLLLKICDSITFLIVLQCVCFAIVFVDGILFFYYCGFSKKVLGLFYLFIVFGVSNIIQLVTLWKDIPYMVSIMWLTLLLMKFVMMPGKYAGNTGWYIQFVIAVIFTAFFRQNGILPALAVIILLPVVTKFSKKAVTACILCILLMAAVKGPLYRFMNVIPHPPLKFFSLSNDIMYSYYMGDSVSEEAMELINKITDDVPDDFAYNPYWVNYNPDEPDGYSVMEFLKLYMKNFFEHPRMAVKAVLTRNSVIWSIVKPVDEVAGCVNCLLDHPSHSPDLFPRRAENQLTHILEDFCKWFTERMILYPFYWRTGIYNLLIVCMAVITFCTEAGKKLWNLMPYVPISVNLAALFISSGWTDYRYFWPAMTISLFLFFYFLYSRSGQSF